MKAAHDVELARRHPARLLRLVVHLLERPRVRTLFLRHPGERAEHAGVPEDADVGRIDVLVGREQDAVAVPARVGEVRQAAEPEEIGRSVERHAVRGVQPLAGKHLVGERVEGRVSQLEGGNAVGHAISLGERR